MILGKLTPEEQASAGVTPGLVRLAVGLLTATSGTVRLFGADIGRFREWSRIGYVPQGLGLHDDLTAADLKRCHEYAVKGIYEATQAKEKKG